ncbi:hypothetical protein CK510_00205 [Brunnivagina elsteri CCALA 953]|uniref:Uncharacterized protein n=1 Tax=Brunnivagina elsteri CCALA 953 TaxID=987040 RepID=A0A2A2TQE9_9CYAN|nr:hypothetical protein CK510_00205 [Calothrix elsteri CCALA 953]
MNGQNLVVIFDWFIASSYGKHKHKPITTKQKPLIINQHYIKVFINGIDVSVFIVPFYPLLITHYHLILEG